MRKIKVVVLLVQQLQHGFTKNAKVSPNLTVAHIHSVFDRYSFNQYYIYIYIILFHESRHFYHITIEWGRLYCIDTSLSQHGEHLINDTKHNIYVVGQRLKTSR